MDEKKKKPSYGNKTRGKKAAFAGNGDKRDPFDSKKMAEQIVKEGLKRGRQDPQWWTKYPDLSKDALNFVFNTIAGMPFDVKLNYFNKDQDFNRIPVGARLEYIPTIGTSTNPNDAFNFQMRALWLDMHRKYRGIGTYEYADLGCAIFAIVNVFADIARAERVYGVASLFNARNRSYPRTLLKACLVDPDSVEAGSLADFRYQLNRLILKAKTLCLPKDISALSCYVGLMSNVFKDSDNIRAQWFLYDSPYRVQYSADAVDTGSSCIYVERTKNKDDLQNLAHIIRDLEEDIDILLGDTDVARMVSDLLAAYGDGNVTTLLMLPEDYTVVPTKVEERTLQLHNTSLVGAMRGAVLPKGYAESGVSLEDRLATLAITQVNGSLIQVLGPDWVNDSEQSQLLQYRERADALGTNVPGYAYEMMLTGSGTLQANTYLNSYSGSVIGDTWVDDPDDNHRVEMLQQLQVIDFDVRQPVPGSFYFATAITRDSGVYIVETMRVYYNEGDPSEAHHALLDREKDLDMYEFIAAISKLDWHPMFATFTSDGVALLELVYDMDNYTIVDSLALRRVHQASTLSAFKVQGSVSTDK